MSVAWDRITSRYPLHVVCECVLKVCACEACEGIDSPDKHLWEHLTSIPNWEGDKGNHDCGAAHGGRAEVMETRLPWDPTESLGHGRLLIGDRSSMFQK